MKSTRILKMFTVAAAMFAAVMTTSASAAAGPVNQFLTGGVVDPMATTLRVLPPKGGMVMVHRNGQAVAWFSRAGVVNLKPNQVYTLTATRGSSMLFTGNVMMRRGFTEAVWTQGATPQMSYVPVYGQGFRQPPARIGSRRRAPTTHHQTRSTRSRATTRSTSTTRSTARRSTATRSTATTRSTRAVQTKRSTSTRTAKARTAKARTAARPRMNSKSHRQLVRRLKRQRTDSARLNTVTRYNRNYRLTTSQKRALTRTFANAAYRAKAAKSLGVGGRTQAKRAKRATTSKPKSASRRSRRVLSARR